MIIKSARIIRAFNLFKTGTGQPFSAEKEKMKLLRDRALLASNIIKRIRTNNTIDDLSHLPLSESIVKYLEKVKNVEEKARQELLDYFKNGIQYNPQIFSQQRVLRAQYQKSKLKFYPTNFVTGQLFRRLIGPKYQFSLQGNTMYTGNFGISKSFSAILFAKLSNMIAQYNFQNYPQRQYLDQTSEIIDSPKIIYYNYKEQQILESNKIRQIILKQCRSQIGSQQQKNYLNREKYLKPVNQGYQDSKLKDFYRKREIEIYLFIDQISQYFSLVRRYRQSKGEDIEQMMTKINIFKSQIKGFDSHFNSTVYFSSMDVERDLIVEAKIQSQNSSIREVKFKYSQYLHKDEYMRQLVGIFLFCIGQKLQIKLLNQDKHQAGISIKRKNSFRKKIKSELFSYLQTIKLQYFLSFLFIRESIEKQSDLLVPEINQVGQDEYLEINSYDETELQSFIMEWFKKAIKYSEQKLDQAFGEFIKKRQIDQAFFNILAFQLYIAAQIAIRTGSNFIDYEINLEKYSEGSRNKWYLGRSLYKQIFSFDNKIAKCIVPPKIIIKILSPLITKTLPYILKNKIQFMHNITTRVGLGGCVQILLIATILLGNKKLLLYQQSFTPVISIENISTKRYEFKEIPKNLLQQSAQEKDYIFLDSLKPSLAEQIETMKSQKIVKKSLVFVPVHTDHISNQYILDKISLLESKIFQLKPEEVKILKKCKNIIKSGYSMRKSQTSETSKAIDVIIATIQRLEGINLLKIYALDITISDKQEIPKLKKFIKQFSNFKDRYQNELTIKNQKYQVELNYFVISPISQSSNIIDSLNQKFNESFEFSPVASTEYDMSKNKHYLAVQNKQNNKCMLKHVGCFHLFSELNVVPENVRTEQNLSNSETFQLWTYLQKNLKEIAQKRKVNNAEMKRLFRIMKKYLKDQVVIEEPKNEAGENLE